MARCKSITSKRRQCARSALWGTRYCWQHHGLPFKITTLGVLGLIATYLLQGIGLWADLSSLGFLKLKENSNASYVNLVDRGNGAFSIGQYNEALNYFKQALVIARETGDRAGEGVSLNSIGGVY